MAQSSGGVVALPSMGMYASTLLPADHVQTVGSVSVLQVRPDVYMVTVGGANLAVQTGLDGSVVIDSGAGDCQDVVAALARVVQGPVRYVIDTSADTDRTGCSGALANAGQQFQYLDAEGLHVGSAQVIAQLNTLHNISQQGALQPTATLPTDTFSRAAMNFSLGAEGVQLFWMPAAHTDGDAIVVLRQSDVVVAGNIFDETHFPVIDVAHGGSVQGEIDALNRLLEEFTVAPTPKWEGRYGTLVIPGRGHLCDQTDVLTYRDMVTIVRDRIASLIDHGSSLSQIQAADPTRGYASRYGTEQGPWTTRDFVAAVYSSLLAQRRARGGG